VYFTLKTLVRTLILPPASPLILAWIGAMLVRRRWRSGWLLLAGGLASLWLFCTPFVADSLSAWAERYPALDPSRPTGAQAIVILAGGGQRLQAPEYAGPVSDSLSLERVAYGAFLAKRTSLPVLVTGTDEETTSMQATLSRNFGVQTRWVENRSRDTYQNAHFSARLVRGAGIRRIILVTTSTHEWRAAHEFTDAGFEVVPAPEGMLSRREFGVFRFVPAATALVRSNAAVYELIGEQARRLQAALGVRERFDTSRVR